MAPSATGLGIGAPPRTARRNFRGRETSETHPRESMSPQCSTRAPAYAAERPTRRSSGKCRMHAAG
eukprot:CAMPEP_0176296092 /NCGR_PEP_ID=MMETSP0121_2-20121125/58016_1 /TAXON_ID=160619 /ORGANISM="Kryptoperidinium foliaceum, Strain CCMP 1326" /LENGTH=65 /DNA_ID=CAMNT_0017637215 /DNA_START=108 /DNA_END=302 /DNA_ORIENTATION=-